MTASFGQPRRTSSICSGFQRERMLTRCSGIALPNTVLAFSSGSTLGSRASFRLRPDPTRSIKLPRDGSWTSLSSCTPSSPALRWKSGAGMGAARASAAAGPARHLAAGGGLTLFRLRKQSYLRNYGCSGCIRNPAFDDGRPFVSSISVFGAPPRWHRFKARGVDHSATVRSDWVVDRERKRGAWPLAAYLIRGLTPVRCAQAPLLLKRQANLANTTDAVLPHRAPALPKLA